MGADKVARFFIGVAGKNSGRDIRIEPTTINGTVGALLYMDGEIDHSLSLAIDGEPDCRDLHRTQSPINCVTSRASANTGALKYSVHRIGQRLAGKKRVEIGDHAVLHRRMRLQRMAADMRGQHDVRQRGQRVRRMRLLR